MEMDAKILIF